jgi:MoxR-like ATPase
MGGILTYTGEKLRDGYSDDQIELQPYFPSPELVRAVNVALFLKKRPLLLMGEPGVGKTCLAESVAYELLGGSEKMKEGPHKQYFKWSIKSTSKALDGLYRYDALRRLHDSQIFKNSNEKDPNSDNDKLNNTKLGAKDSYVQPGELARAILSSTNECRSIILIDEIDKAGIDFANDLLNELENYEFTIPETGESVKRPANFQYPLVIITSNRERELPPAFLRRCLYHFINFPDEVALKNILDAAIRKESQIMVSDELIRDAIAKFIAERQKSSESEKKPSTSELLDWFKVVAYYDNRKHVNKDISSLSTYEQEMIKSLDLLEDPDKIPFPEVLLKTYETYSVALANAATAEK